ncbi:MAG: TonB family protein [Chitinivibrionales bacterium]|nr:TonB family protein [Chitinivibrionales bacterium]MBD3396240.1 TonB family protein [Chitinivibrionales bacterium]
MRHTLSHRSATAVAVFCVLVSCGRKPKEDKPAAVVGADTITVGEIKEIATDTSAASLKRAAMQASLSKRAARPADTARYRKSVDEVAQQLALRTSREWTSSQASSLLNATRALRAEIDTAADPAAVARRVDSLAGSVDLLCRSDTGAAAPESAAAMPVISDTSAQGRRAALAAVIRKAFALSPELADILADFAAEDVEGGRDSMAVKDIVKGLVYEPKEDLAKESMPLSSRRRDNSAEALRHRTRASIMDSIGRHLPHLEALYKKRLKIHQNIAGTVVVSFRVDAAGRVMSARVVRSDIREDEFLKPFAEYVKTIRFRPIPRRVGPMTFEFPFEFKAES